MPRITGKRIVAIIIILAIIAAPYYFTEMRINILAGETVKYLEDFRDYYIGSKQKGYSGLNGAINRQIIYFWPGQRKIMVEEIRKDIAESLETLITEYADSVDRYEVIDDYKQVLIYETNGGPGAGDLSSYGGPISRIRSILCLYHGVKDRKEASIPTTFKFEIAYQMPSNVRFEDITSKSFRVQWDSIPGAYFYELSIDNGEKWIDVYRGTTENDRFKDGYTFRSLKPETTYHVLLRAHTPGRGIGQAWSGSVRTLAP